MDSVFSGRLQALFEYIKLRVRHSSELHPTPQFGPVTTDWWSVTHLSNQEFVPDDANCKNVVRFMGWQSLLLLWRGIRNGSETLKPLSDRLTSCRSSLSEPRMRSDAKVHDFESG